MIEGCTHPSIMARVDKMDWTGNRFLGFPMLLGVCILR